jgi:hypothetical protein
MHLLEWRWWLALPAAIILALIPVLGWLALIILALFGGYSLIDGGFNPGQTVSSFEKMPIIQWDEYRRNVLPYGLAKACKEYQAKVLGTGSELPIRASNYCDCYGQASADTLTQADLAFQQRTGAYSEDATTRLKDAVTSRCNR